MHDVVEAANVSEDNISEHDFEYVAGFIILKLLDHHCIKEEHHNHEGNRTNGNEEIPAPGFFVDEIFQEFGNKSLMTYENFEAFYSKLKLGKTAQNTSSKTKNSHDNHDDHDDHDGHDHRRKRRATDDDHDHDRDHDHNKEEHNEYKRVCMYVWFKDIKFEEKLHNSKYEKLLHISIYYQALPLDPILSVVC